MKKHIALCVLLGLVTASATIQGQDGRALVMAAVDAMGAQNLRTLQWTGGGSNAGIGQSFSPQSPWPLVQVKSYTRQIDFDGLASSAQLIRIQNGAEQTQNQVIPANAPWSQQYDIWITPYGFLKGAMANPVTLRSETVVETKYNVVSFVLQDKYKVEGFINDKNFVERVRTWVDNDVLGDMLVEAYYIDYKDFGGLKAPTFAVVKQNGNPTLILNVRDAKANAPVNIPPPVQAAAAPAVTVEAEEIAPGVFYLKGGTHHSVAVEFADHVALIEGPQNQQRALALMDEVKKLFPNKPLRYVVNTHHHFDHSGGLRAFVDAGVTIVTQDVNRTFYEAVFKRPRTVNPDRLEQSKKNPVIQPVSDKYVMSDATRTLELYLIKNNPHNAGILMAFLPKEKILVEVDMYTPPAPGAAAPALNAPVDPNALALLNNLEALRLDFETILPLHGPGKATRANLYSFVRKPLVPVSALPDPNISAAAARAAALRPPLPADVTGPDAEVAALVNTVCSSCHNFDRVNAKRENQAAWQDTVMRMKTKGAAVSDAQLPIVVEYLSRILPR